MYMETTETAEDKKRKACMEKLTWRSRELAEAAGAYAVWQYGGANSRTKAYNCKYCGLWHLARAVE